MKNRNLPFACSLVGCILLGGQADAQHYTQTNLVSDQPGATVTDANLVNPWGLARSTTSTWWSANNGTGTATLYNGNTGARAALIVTIPPASSASDHGSPTGAVSNGTAAFELTPGNPARFLFVTQDGTISGWNPAVDATHALVKVTSPDAVYTGVAIASRDGSQFLYVANFAERRIEVFDSSFQRVHAGGMHHLAEGGYDADDDHDGARHDGDRQHGDRFRDERIPRGFAPFNVQNIGGDLYVTFAKQDPVINVAAGPGLGYVDVFSPSGRLLRRLQHGPWLNAPWGVAQAPGDFGAFGHNLLVGQFRSGEIAAYDVATGAFLGKVLKAAGSDAFTTEGLWALGFGNGGNAGPLNTLFFTAGIEGEKQGLFGTLTAIAAEQVFGNGR
jgi:uncharacterized protein (TIGR03118 family)